MGVVLVWACLFAGFGAVFAGVKAVFWMVLQVTACIGLCSLNIGLCSLQLVVWWSCFQRAHAQNSIPVTVLAQYEHALLLSMAGSPVL